MKSSYAIRAGDEILLRVPAVEPTPLVPEPIPLDILHEDDALIVLNKRAGIAVHPGAGRSTGTLVHALLSRGPLWSSVGGQERPGIVHRLDRNTSGVIVVARTDAAHRSLAAQFKDRTVEKVYLALSWGTSREEEFTVDAPLGRDRIDRKRMSSRTASPRAALTSFRVLQRFTRWTFLEARPKTGRTHQIRVHLKSRGLPIVGDELYGSGRSGEVPERGAREALALFDGMALHAWRLTFNHPGDKRPVSFEAPIPEAFASLLAALPRAGRE